MADQTNMTKDKFKENLGNEMCERLLEWERTNSCVWLDDFSRERRTLVAKLQEEINQRMAKWRQIHPVEKWRQIHPVIPM